MIPVNAAALREPAETRIVPAVGRPRFALCRQAEIPLAGSDPTYLNRTLVQSASPVVPRHNVTTSPDSDPRARPPSERQHTFLLSIEANRMRTPPARSVPQCLVRRPSRQRQRADIGQLSTPLQLTGLPAMKRASSFAAFAPQRYCGLS